MTDADILARARTVFEIEIEALAHVRDSIDGAFARAARALLDCRGKVIVTGLGKSGAVSRKFAATLSSTGTPAVFLHASEGMHGDLGVIDRQDVVVAISYSGETGDLGQILPTIKRLGVPLIALTGRTDSTLARAADVVVPAAVPREACPLGLAPTSSTTAALALADALAVVVHQLRGFTEEDFAMRHPGGSLGRRLLRVSDLMHTGDELPVCREDAPLGDAIVEMTKKSLGMVCVVDASGRLCGILTDGDLRRLLQKRQPDLIDRKVADTIISRSPSTIDPDYLVVQALTVMEDKKRTSLIIVDPEHRPVGVIHVHDILRSKAV